jgi:hypothetical protein
MKANDTTNTIDTTPISTAEISRTHTPVDTTCTTVIIGRSPSTTHPTEKKTHIEEITIAGEATMTEGGTVDTTATHVTITTTTTTGAILSTSEKMTAASPSKKDQKVALSRSTDAKTKAAIVTPNEEMTAPIASKGKGTIASTDRPSVATKATSTTNDRRTTVGAGANIFLIEISNGKD